MSFNLQRFHYIPESVTHFTQELPSAARVHSLTFSTLADVEIDLQFMLRTCFASGLVISSTIWWGGGGGRLHSWVGAFVTEAISRCRNAAKSGDGSTVATVRAEFLLVACLVFAVALEVLALHVKDTASSPQQEAANVSFFRGHGEIETETWSRVLRAE